MKTEENPFSDGRQEIMSPHIEYCIGKCPGLYTIFFKTSTCLCFITQLIRCLGYETLDFFHCYAPTVLWCL